MVNWAEIKFGLRLKKLAQKARERVRARKGEDEDEKRERFRIHVWNTLTDASYSTQAACTVALIGICILLSTLCFIFETLPTLERSVFWSDIFFYAEIFFVAIFTLELALRIWSTPQPLSQFFKDPMNIIDIISILPFYVELALMLLAADSMLELDLRFLRALRLFRMLKMGRFSSELQLLAEGLVRSKGSLLLLCATLVLGIIFYATLMWIVEMGTWNPESQCFARENEVNFDGCSPYQSVPSGFWWGIVTMTTVGYGDAYPVTVWGRVIGGFAMICGIFCVAIPASLLCEDFANLHKEKQLEGRQGKLADHTHSRTKDQIELHLNSVRLQQLTRKMDGKLLNLKHLRIAYAEHSDNDEDDTMVDPIFSSFHSQAINGMDNLVVTIHKMTDNLS